MPADNSKSGRAPKPRDPATAAVLERLESRLTAVLSESVSPALPYAPYLTAADFADTFDRFAYPSGYPTDRKAGKNYPVIRNETDLRTARAFSRFLADTNPLVIGFLDHITNFVVGTGYKWTVGLKGAAGNSPQEKADPAVVACQAVLDEFRSLNGWGDQHEITFGDLADDGDDSPSTDLEAECWRSAMRDGETFLRLFRGGASTNGIPRVRRVNPECVYCPPGEFSEGPWSFGVETDSDDRQKRIAFHVADPDLYPTGGEIVPARSVVHFKLNVDSDIKRGVPDFWPLENEVQHLRKSWQNMAEVTAILSAIAYIRQHAAGVSGTQIRNMADAIKSGTDSRSAKFYDQFQGGDIYRTYTRHEGGTVVDITNGMEFVSPPAVAGMPGFVQGMQAVLRIVGLRWGCPEYFSGDSSNANYASTLVAGGPFERAAQRRQQIYKQFQGNLIHRVLLLAAESGRLSTDVIRKVAVKVTAPAVAIANKAEDTSRRVQLMQVAGLSKRTVLEEEGYDPDQEAANVQKEQPPAPPGGGGGGEPPQDGNPVPQGGPSPAAGPAPQPATEQPPADLAASLFGEAKVSEADAPEPAANPLPPELLAALLLAHQEGNQDAVDQLLELANDPTLLAAVMDGPPDDDAVSEAVDRSHLVFDKVKKRWVNPNKEAPVRKTPAGQLTPKEQLIARKQAAEPARQAAREAWAGAVADPSKVTADQLAGLAGHLHALTRDELREVARGLAKSPSGLKKDVVGRLLEHVGARSPVPPSGPPMRANGTPDAPKVEDVFTVPVDSLKVDPARFQYKISGIGAGGVGKELKGADSWNPELGGTLLVWRDPADGQDYVVNGHHRHDLATRLNAGRVNVRYITAGSAAEARAKGALANIAEGRGTATDAAKFLRDSGGTVDNLRRAGVSLSGKIAADAVQLQGLSDKAFQSLAEGRIDEAKAVAVAKHLKDPKLQDLLFRKLADREDEGKDWTPGQIETAAKKMASAGKATATETNLFGTFEDEHSTFDQEVELEHHIGRQLAQEANDYAAVASTRRADRVSGAGNQLNTDENARRRDAATQSAALFDQHANLIGPVSAAIKAGAAKLLAAKTKKEKERVKSETLEAVRSAVAEVGGGKPTPAHAGPVGGGGSGHAAPAQPAEQPAAGEQGRGQVDAKFTGVAANGVRYVDGVAQKGEDRSAKAADPVADIERHIADWQPGGAKYRQYETTGRQPADLEAADGEATALLDRLDQSALTTDDLKALAKRLTGVPGKTRREALLSIRGKMTSIRRILSGLKS